MDNIAIVLTIFDGYSDMWDDCINRINKYWNNHPPIYVFTNEIVKDWGEGVYCYSVGKDAEWSKKAKMATEIVKEDFIVLLLEDFFIGKKIDIHEVEKLIDFMKKNKIVYAKLCDNNRVLYKHKRKYNKNYPYEVIYKDERDAVCLQTSIWNRKFLGRLVGDENYNAWIFELNQIKKSIDAPHRINKNMIEDYRNILNIKHGALQGKLLPPTVRYFSKIKDPLFTDRSVMSTKEYTKYYIKQIGRDITPKIAKNIMKKIGRRMGYSFVSDKWDNQ